MKPKIKLATSRDVYNRILWDSNYNQRAFFIQFIDRVSTTGLREKPLIEWAGGDIPWSRVQSIRCGNEIVWDRNLRIDLFASEELPNEAYLTSEQNNLVVQEDVFVPKSVFFYENDVWTFYTKGIQKSYKKEKLSILSWNVLANNYEKEHYQFRYQSIIQKLEKSNVDVIVLQEVTVYFLEELMKQNWVKKYYLSTLPNALLKRSHAVVILSKIPFSLVEHAYSFEKRFPIATWNVQEKYVSLAGIHLSSNQAENADEIRETQLNQLIDYLEQQLTDYWIVGDFNMRGNEGKAILKKHQLSDCWLEKYPTENGYTFEPESNVLAKSSTKTNEPARFDRVLSKVLEWKLNTIEYLGTKAVLSNKIHLSDHYGVLTSFDFESKKIVKNYLEEIKPTYESGIVIIPPTFVCQMIQPLRDKYDAKAFRWMPHITLVYGFIPEEYFEEASQLIAEKITQVLPFDINLKDYQSFSHQNKETLWLNPVTENNELIDLQTVLQTCFPQCNEQIKNVGFNPHMSIGQFQTMKEAFQKLPTWTPVSFLVESIALISRKGNEPFEERYRIHLKSGEIELMDEKLISQNELMNLINAKIPLITNEQKSQKEMVFELLQVVCQDVLDYPIELHAVGSTYLGTATATSDLDLLCLIPNHFTQIDFLELMCLEMEGFTTKMNLVLDAQVPTLRMEIEGVRIDLLCAQNPNFPSPIHQINSGDYHQFSKESWQALSSYFEAQKTQKLVLKKVRLATFQNFIKVIRVWATARKIKGNAFGYLGTYSWTVLATWTIIEFEETNQLNSLEALLFAFFTKVKNHDWTKPIALTEEGGNIKIRPKQDRMPIVTSTTPCFNSARNITFSTAQTLKLEFERAVKIMSQSTISWEVLFQEKELEGEKMVIRLESKNKENLQKARGWIEGHLLGLIISLEQEGVFVQSSTEFIEGGIENGKFQETFLFLSKSVSQSSINHFIHKFEQENSLVKLIIE